MNLTIRTKVLASDTSRPEGIQNPSTAPEILKIEVSGSFLFTVLAQSYQKTKIML